MNPIAVSGAPDSIVEVEYGTINSVIEEIMLQAEVVELVRRCHAVVRHLEENPDDAMLLVGTLTNISSTDLARCIDIVCQNLTLVHALHARRPIAAFKPFSSEEAQFLADLNAHVQSSS